MTCELHGEIKEQIRDHEKRIVSLEKSDAEFAIRLENLIGDTCVSHSDEVCKTQQELLERGYLQRFDPYMLDNSRQNGQYLGTNGWYPREAKHNLQKIGICRRGLFDSKPFNGKLVQYNEKVLEDAQYQKIDTYFRINTRDEMVSNVKFNGGFTIAIPLYKGFSSIRSLNNELPIIPLPKPGEKPWGYHQVAAQGIMFSMGGIKILNSYGTTWGRRGYAVLPWEYPIEEIWGSKDKYLPVLEVATEDIILWIGKTTYQAGSRMGEMDVAPYIDPVAGRTMIPLRFIGQALGFFIMDPENKTDKTAKIS